MLKQHTWRHSSAEKDHNQIGQLLRTAKARSDGAQRPHGARLRCSFPRATVQALVQSQGNRLKQRHLIRSQRVHHRSIALVLRREVGIIRSRSGCRRRLLHDPWKREFKLEGHGSCALPSFYHAI
eukprot:6057340-Prymnesium_polylepis.1